MTQSSNGSVSIGPVAGEVTYTPNPSFFGTDTYIYQVCNDANPVVCDAATVTITVDQNLTWESETKVVAYEDLKNYGWSDWDYNDFVVQMVISKGLTAEGNLAALQIDYEALARGAGFNQSFIHDLPLTAGGTASLEIWDDQGKSILHDNYSFSEDTNFTIFDSTKSALPPLPGFFNTNTAPSQPGVVSGYTAELIVYLNDPTANPAIALQPTPWDPYIYLPYTGQEVHLVIPGHLDNMQTVNDVYDPATPLLGYDLPMAQTFDTGWLWPIEFSGIGRGYPDYVSYVGIGGTSNLDWWHLENADSQWLWMTNNGEIPQGKSPIEGMTGSETSRYFASPTIADLDSDGQNEIILATLLSGEIEVYNAGHEMQLGWPQVIGSDIKAAATTADLDQDGDLEIIVGASDGKVYAWHHDGQSVSGWPVVLDSGFKSAGHTFSGRP